MSNSPPHPPPPVLERAWVGLFGGEGKRGEEEEEEEEEDRVRRVFGLGGGSLSVVGFLALLPHGCLRPLLPPRELSASGGGGGGGGGEREWVWVEGH